MIVKRVQGTLPSTWISRSKIENFDLKSLKAVTNLRRHNEMLHHAMAVVGNKTITPAIQNIYTRSHTEYMHRLYATRDRGMHVPPRGGGIYAHTRYTAVLY